MTLGVLAVINVGMTISGFHIDGVTDVPDVEGRLWRMIYEKNGAELVWLERKDEVKTFAVAFKTLPEDDTGVAHILEHSVLAGSEKYPVKSPFGELRKSSLRVFMNAMTARDATYYPFSTRNDQDFLNLADVYLDAVFHPRSLKSPLAFRQEGWHYELDEKTGALSYNGVVYNEMKGVYADSERAATREVCRYLYPDIVYRNDSGGRPDAIPNLTYENYRVFYRKHYHPSNSRIFLDGSVDLPTILAKLDSVLRDFDRAEKAAPIPMQAPVFCRKTIPFASSDCTKKTILVDAWSVGTFRDVVRHAALDVLEEYLVGSNEAPLKKALLSRNICEDLQMYCSGYQQIPLVAIFRNTTDAQAEECRAVFRETLQELVENGLDHVRLDAIINRNEFREREVNGSHPRGLAYLSSALDHWLYGGDPAAAFDITGICRQLREGVGSGLFERCVRETILENPHHVELTFSPDSRLVGEEERMRADKLARLRSAMSEAEIARLKREMSELTEFQKREDTDAEKATIPTLRVSDIPKNGRISEHAITTEGGVAVVRTKATNRGIVYISACFPMDGLGAQELAKMPLFASLHGKLATARRDALSLQTDLQANVGRMNFYVIAEERGNYLRADIAVLASKDAAAIGLLKEIIHETRYDDVESIEKLRRQRLISAERNVAMRGDSIAERYSLRKISRRWASLDAVDGYAQLRWLQNAVSDKALAAQYDEMARRIFVRDGLVLSYTDNISSRAAEMLKKLVEPSDGSMLAEAEVLPFGDELEGLRIDGDTGYSETVAALPEGYAFNGAMRVAAKILSLGYLHREIREIGGAYGTRISIHPSRIITCFTYRDPTPFESLRIVRGCGEAMRTFAKSGEDLDRYIVATIAEVDPYMSPSAEASRPVDLFLRMRTPADEELVRKQVLETEREDLLKVADMLDDQIKKANHLIVGGERQMKPLPADKVRELRSR